MDSGVCVLLMCAALAMVWAWRRVVGRQREEALARVTAVGETLGLEAVAAPLHGAGFDALGVEEGMLLRVVVSDGVGRVEWGVGFGVEGARLQRSGAAEQRDNVLALGAAFGAPVKTGDAAFDAAFEVVGGEDAEAVARMLSAPVRAQMLALDKARVGVEADALRVAWSQQRFTASPSELVEASRALACALRRSRSDALVGLASRVGHDRAEDDPPRDEAEQQRAVEVGIRATAGRK